MKNFTYSLLPALFSFLFFATNNPENTPPPKEEEIRTYSLFDVGNSRKGEFKDLTGGVYLDLSSKSLSSLYNERPSNLNFLLPGEEEELQLSLTEAQILTDDYKSMVMTEDGKKEFKYKKGLYYHGKVEGYPKSLVSISIFEKKVMGILTFGGQNYNLGPINKYSKDTESSYILYKEKDLKTPPTHGCDVTAEESQAVDMLSTLNSINGVTAQKQANVVRVWIEADNVMYRDFGSDEQNVVDHFTGLFNEVAMLYANEQILTRISGWMVYAANDPYPKTSTRAALDEMMNTVGDSFDGDLAHYISTHQYGGGVAWLDVLCFKGRGHAVSGIDSRLIPVPTYSWSVEVFTHEMGHNLGSPHTQACNWGPGGNSALDDCYPTEGGCSRGPTPTNGGTIMSYCHLAAPGINFENGFGIEPGNLVRQKVELASCLEEVFDCFSKIELKPGITYRGDSRNGGATEFDDYACTTVAHRGTEIAHVFKPNVSGWAYITYTENIPEQMNLLLVPECKPEDCTDFWEGAPIVRDSFFATGGEEYTFITDVVEDSPGGEYTLRISFPNAACNTDAVLEEGVIFSGDTRDQGTANVQSYNCSGETYLGNERGHSFTPSSDGRAYLYYSENVPEQMDLFMTTACNANSCLESWTGAPSVRDSFDVVAGQTYFFFVDVKEDSEGGAYDILISFPGTGCGTIVSLANGVTYSGNTSDGFGNFVNYACSLPPQSGSEVGHYFISAVEGEAILTFNGPGLTLIQGDGCNPDSCYNTWSSGSVNEEIAINALEPYYFIVDRGAAGTGDYDITITMQPLANKCFCQDPTVDICENFDSYDPGPVSPQSDCLTQTGTSDGQVYQPTGPTGAKSGENALRVTNGQSTVIDLGNRSFGSHIMKFSVSMEAGKEGYFRMYHVYDKDNPQNNEVAFDIRMELNDFSGVTFGKLFAGNTNPGASVGNVFSSFPVFKEFVLNIDIDNDMASLSFAGTQIHSWPFSYWRNGTNGTAVAAAMEFYSEGAITEYLVDDFRFYENAGRFCESSGGLYCEDFDDYNDEELIVSTTPRNGWFLNDGDGDNRAPAGQSPRGSFTQSFSGITGMQIVAGASGSQWDDVVCLPFGQPIGGQGKMKVSMMLYIPNGSEAQMQTLHDLSFDGDPTNENWANHVFFEVGGNGYILSGGTQYNFSYNDNTWIEYVQLIDFDEDVTTIFIQGVAVASYNFSNTLLGQGSNGNWLGLAFNTLDPSVGITDGLPYRNNNTWFFVDNVEVFDQSLFLNIDPEDLFVDYPSGSRDIGITTNLPLDWTAESLDPWLNVTPNSGNGNGIVTINWQENLEITNRVGEVIIKGRGAPPKTVTVTQIGTIPFLDVTPDGVITADPDGEDLTFDVSANVIWGVTPKDANWIVPFVGSGGDKDGQFTVTIERNLGAARSDTLFVEGQPAAPGIIIIEQGPGNDFVGINLDTLCLPALSGTESFEVEANVDWTIDNNSGWFTTTPTAGNGTQTVSIDYQANPTANIRYYDLGITAAGTPPANLVVKQLAEAPFLEADKSFVNVGVPAGMESFSISSNVDWEIDADQFWYTLSTTSGNGNQTINIDYEENRDPFQRTDSIFITGSNGVSDVLVIIRQEGAGNILNVTPTTTFNVGVGAGDTCIFIESNVSWGLATSNLWIDIDGQGIGPVGGLGDGKIVLGWQENNSTTPRTGTITITGPGVNPITITINQEGGVANLCLAPTTIDLDSPGGTFLFDVISNQPNWDIMSNVSWLTLNRNIGGGNANVTATYTENVAPTNRTAIITLTAPGLPSKELTVFQSGQGFVFEVSEDTICVNQDLQIAMFNVTSSNLFWTVSDDASWMQIPGPSSSGFGNGTVDVQILNNTGTTRYGNVMVEVMNAPPKVVVIKQTGIAPDLTVNPTTINVTAPAGFEEITVTSNCEWTAVSNDSWITITDPQGSVNGNGTVDFSYTENMDTSPRTGTITISCGALSRTIEVTQEGAGLTLDVSPLDITVDAPMTSRTVKVTSNGDWCVVSNDSWITIGSGANGTGNGDVVLDFSENTSPSSRTGSVVISTKGTVVTEILVSITQNGAAGTLAVDRNTINVTAPAGMEDVSISSNKNWTVSTNDSWISLPTQSGSNDGSFTVQYAENTSIDPRTGTVTVSAAGCPDQIITVTQEGQTVDFTIDNQTINVTAPQGTATVQLSSNVDWEICNINDAWITSVMAMSGTGDAELTITYDENTSTAGRTGTFEICGNDNSVSITVTVVQAGSGVIFTVNTNDINVQFPAGNESISLSANVDWTVKVSDSWIQADPMMGNGDASINISYDENTSVDPRMGTVTICSQGQPDQVITISQAGVATFVEIDPTSITVDQGAGLTSASILSNTDWTVKTNATWLTISPTQGSGNSNLEIEYDENPDLAERMAEVRICAAGLPDQVLTVTQSGRMGNLSVNPTILNVDASQTNTSFDITADVDWTVKTSDTWLNITPLSGSGDGTISVTVAENSSSDPRTGLITICSPGLTDRTVTVSQAGAVAAQLTVTPTLINLTASPGGTRTITVNSNIDWQTVRTLGSWWSITPEMGTAGTTEVTLTYDENGTPDPRTGTITFSGVGVPDVIVEIVQEGVNNNLNVDKNAINLTADAGSNGFNITSNVDWQITDDANGWITGYNPTDSGSGNENITFDYEENTDLAPRTATITITGLGGTGTREIVVTQAGKNAILDATPEVINVDSDSGMESFDITANVGWVISASAGWVNNFSTIMDSGDQSVSFSYDENNTGGSRTALITITGGGLSKDIEVNQAAPDFFLDVDREVINLTADAGDEMFRILSNVSWDIDVPAAATTWLTPTSGVSGSNSGEFRFNYSENTDPNVRTAILTITGAGGVATKTVEINQQGTVPLFIDVSPTDISKTSIPGNQIVNITSNNDWEVCTDAPWVELTPETGSGTGFFVISFSSNPTADDRVATVVVKSPGLPDQTITLTQGGFSPLLDADTKDFTVGSFQGTVEFNVISNLSWNINSDATWAQPVNAFGMSDELVVVRYETNPTPSPRMATLTLSTPIQGVPDVTITINQSQTNSTAELQKLYDLSLYPNPVSEDLNIEFQLLRGEELVIDILDITGKQLDVISDDSFGVSEYKISHNVNALAPGIYLLRFKSEVGVLTKRFVVN